MQGVDQFLEEDEEGVEVPRSGSGERGSGGRKRLHSPEFIADMAAAAAPYLATVTVARKRPLQGSSNRGARFLRGSFPRVPLARASKSSP
jgi:hypothetical protein